MDWQERYEKVKPYGDKDVEAILAGVLNNPLLGKVMSYLFEPEEGKAKMERLRQVKTVKDFQAVFSNDAVKRVLEKTASSFSASGLNNIKPDTPYLFIANHRDIVLDSAIMQSVLLSNGHETSQITLGSNLMYNQFIVDLAKLNKMFVFERSGGRREQYENMLFHSKYIQHVITQEKESIWIAQRDGRTKDGLDKTQQALVKMLIGKRKDTLQAIQELNIVPVTISYEYEPCDAQKIWEMYHRNQGLPYVKGSDEDFMSVLSGIVDFKGGVQLSFGVPLNEQMNASWEIADKNTIVEKVSEKIDTQVYQDYKLWPTHFCAHDILSKSPRFDRFYTSEDKTKFEQHIEQILSPMKGNKQQLKKMLLEMYANPIISKATSETHTNCCNKSFVLP